MHPSSLKPLSTAQHFCYPLRLPQIHPPRPFVAADFIIFLRQGPNVRKIRKFPLIQLQTGQRQCKLPSSSSSSSDHHHRHPGTLMKYVQWVLWNSRKNPSNIRRCGRTHMFTYGHVGWLAGWLALALSLSLSLSLSSSLSKSYLWRTEYYTSPQP